MTIKVIVIDRMSSSLIPQSLLLLYLNLYTCKMCTNVTLLFSGLYNDKKKQ